MHRRTLAQHATDITIAMCFLALTVYVVSALLMHEFDEYR